MAPRRAAGVLPVLACLLTTGCVGGPVVEEASRPTPAPVAPATTPKPWDDRVLLRPGRGRHHVVQAGSADVTVRVSTIDGGRLELASGPGPGRARALDFPPYVEEGDYPRAVIAVENASDDDVLDPGAHDFSWGATFRLDASSEGRPEDNGNNLVQRGLFSQPTFYKAEVDDDRAACEVRGLRGVVILHSSYTMPADAWFRLECDRLGGYIRLRLWDLGTGELVSTAAKVAEIGTLSTPSGHRGIPLSVGGKVNPDGRITAKASDQFNGSIASAYLRIDD